MQFFSKINFLRFLEAFYTLFLSATVGAILIVGAFTAPSIFTSEFLTHNESGLLMTGIFLKFNYWLYFLILLIVGFEGYRYKNGKRDRTVLLSGFLVISSSLLFTDFYTPQILELLSLNQTKTELFQNVHFASELDFKILFLSLAVLSFRRIWKLLLINEHKGA